MNLPVTNLSRSPYQATKKEIEQCMLPPTPEDGNTMSESGRNPYYPEYLLSTKGFCDKCNRAYHRSCDDMFQTLVTTYGLHWDKENPESLQNALQLCELPVNLSQLDASQLGTLKSKYAEVTRVASSCYKLRQNHHINCSQHLSTGKREADPGHKKWLKGLEKVRDKCKNSLERVRKLRVVATPQKTPVVKLETPHFKRVASSVVNESDEVSRKLKF